MKKMLFAFLLTGALMFAVQSSFSQQTAAGDSLPDLYVITKSATRLFSDTDNLSSVILIIPEGHKVQIYEEVGGYYIASYQDSEGYIFRKNVEFDEATRGYLEALWARQDEAAGESEPSGSRQVQEDRYDYLVGKYGQVHGEKMYNRAIWRGMSRQMVIDSWGKPLKAYSNYRNRANEELWVYRMAELYFEDGQLSDWKRLR